MVMVFLIIMLVLQALVIVGKVLYTVLSIYNEVGDRLTGYCLFTISFNILFFIFIILILLNI